MSFGSSDSRFWKRVDPEGQRVSVFGDHCMLFNPVSWETHFASAHAADVLELIGERSVSRDELDRVLLGPDPAPDESVELTRLLISLEELGLITED
jgi:PqqD family protein of HPr-rel-A system